MTVMCLFVISGCMLWPAPAAADYGQVRFFGDPEPYRGLPNVEARITLLHQESDGWRIRIREVRPKYPGAAPLFGLKKGDELHVLVPGIVEFYRSDGWHSLANCTLKPESAVQNMSRALLTIKEGQTWLAQLNYCNVPLICKREQWLAYVYSRDLITLEYECTQNLEYEE